MHDDERPSAEGTWSWARANWAVILSTLIFIALMAWAVSTLF